MAVAHPALTLVCSAPHSKAEVSNSDGLSRPGGRECQEMLQRESGVSSELSEEGRTSTISAASSLPAAALPVGHA